MAKGDHIRVYRLGYWHHGIDVGDGTVVHFSGEPGAGKKDAEIKRSSMSVFLDGGTLEVIEYSSCNPARIVVYTALKHLGQKGYCLFENNCEHFARYCKTGVHKSEQVKDAVITTGTTAAQAAGAYASIAGVSAAGSVAGLSGAGVMSGLASIGSVGGAVGGIGAIGGIAALAVAPAITSNMAVRKFLEDDEKLSIDEREARSAGRTGAVVGTVASAAGTVGAISASGSVAGLSAAGITSGLAAIGGTVGGGMVAGTAVAIAAPAAAAAAVGYGVYKVFKWIKG